ncbi:MAG TPA: HD domain-containing phosphohydrolase [Planctomycetaceae bacterium]|nr:HD domain-containing phosphohydrolase [Planctomycetaceae bacterium]
MRVLIVDDDEIALELLSAVLVDSGYEVEVARNGREALEILRTGRHRLVVTDWEMPEMDGIQLCRKIRERHFSGYIYVILVTCRDGTANVVEGLDAGADDFIAKPFQPAELCVRLRTGVRLLSLESRDVTIFSLAKLTESRCPETGAHLERIREYCRVIARHLSRQEKFRDQVDGDYAQLIYLTSPLHDIGKVGIPDSVLLKPGPLEPEEYEIMKSHAQIGAETLDAAARLQPEAEFLRMARDIALTHHERYDGSGYPRGLAGREIPLCGRIVAVADVYDALTTQRVYKAAMPHEVARSVILDGSGVHFDPDIVDAFLKNEADFIAIQTREAFETG